MSARYPTAAINSLTLLSAVEAHRKSKLGKRDTIILTIQRGVSVSLLSGTLESIMMNNKPPEGGLLFIMKRNPY